MTPGSTHASTRAEAPRAGTYAPATAGASDTGLSAAVASPLARRDGWRMSLVVLGAIALAIGILILDALPVGVAGDDAMYVILAKSLATGQGYRFLNLPGAPAATHFPPGYPLLLALLWRIAPDFPANVMLFKAANALCLAGITVGTARFANRRMLSRPWALAAAATCMVSMPLLLLGTMLLSEPFFLVLLLLLLPALERFVDVEGAERPSLSRAAVLGLAIGACLLVRTHAIALLPAAAIVLLARRRRREAAALAAVALCCLVPWQVWSARHGGAFPAPLRGEYGSYMGWWMRGLRSLGPRMIPMTLQRTSIETTGMFAILFSPGRGVAAHGVTLLALVGVGTAGVMAQWRRIPVTLLFLAGYLGIVALWPFPSGRFVWGVWPLVLLVLFAGAQRIGEGLRLPGATRRARALHVAGAAAALWLAAGYAAYDTRAVRGRWWSSIARENTRRIVPAVQWTLANTAPSDLVAADDDGAIYLYTGRHTVPVRDFTVDQYLTRVPVERVATDGLLPILAAYPVRTIVVGSVETLDAARWVASQSSPPIALRESFAAGAAFTVLPR